MRASSVLCDAKTDTPAAAVSLVVNYRTYIRPHLEGLGQRVTEATSPPISQYDTTPPPRPSRTAGYVATMREQPKAYATPDAQESLLQREIMLCAYAPSLGDRGTDQSTEREAKWKS